MCDWTCQTWFKIISKTKNSQCMNKIQYNTPP